MSILYFPLVIILSLFFLHPEPESRPVKSTGLQKIHVSVLRGDDELGLLPEGSQAAPLKEISSTVSASTRQNPRKK